MLHQIILDQNAGPFCDDHHGGVLANPDPRVMCRRSHRAGGESCYFAMRQVDWIKGQQAIDTDVFSQAKLDE